MASRSTVPAEGDQALDWSVTPVDARPVRQGERVLVLGGTGFLGSAVTRAMIAGGYDVTVVARRPPRNEGRLAGAQVLLRDATDPITYDDLLDGVSAVIYAVGCLFPQESNAHPLADIHDSLTPLVTLLEALRRRPEIPMVFLSSGGTVYGRPRVLPVTEDHPTNPTTSYGILKLAGEKYIGMYHELYGIQGRILRVANAYGPYQPVGRGQGVIGVFLERVLRGQEVTMFGSGRIVRDYIHTDDVAQAVCASLTKQMPSPLNIGTGVGTSLLQIIDLISEITGESVAVEHLPARGFDVESIVLDVGGFRALTGRDPIDLHAGVADAFERTRAAEPAASNRARQ